MLKMEVKQWLCFSFNRKKSVQGMKDYSWSHNCLFCHWCEAATRLLYLLMDFLRSSNTRARCMFCFMIKGIIFSCGVSLSRWHPAIERLRRVLGYLCGFQNILTDSSFSLLLLICAYISLLMALLISGSNCRLKKKNQPYLDFLMIPNDVAWIT